MHHENASTRNVHRHAATAVRDCGVASGDGGVGGFASRRGLKAVCEREVLFTATERQRNERVSRGPRKLWGGTRRERKVQRKKTDVESEQRKRKESHVVAGSRQRRHAEERETLLHSSPFTPLFFPFLSLFGLPLVSISLTLVRSLARLSFSSDHAGARTPSLSRFQQFLSSSHSRFSSFR